MMGFEVNKFRIRILTYKKRTAIGTDEEPIDKLMTVRDKQKLKIYEQLLGLGHKREKGNKLNLCSGGRVARQIVSLTGCRPVL